MRRFLGILPLIFLLTIPAVMRADMCATTTLNNALGTTRTIGNVTCTLYPFRGVSYGGSKPDVSTLQFLPFSFGNEQSFKITGFGGLAGPPNDLADRAFWFNYAAAPNGTSLTGIDTSAAGSATYDPANTNSDNKQAGSVNYQCFSGLGCVEIPPTTRELAQTTGTLHSPVAIQDNYGHVNKAVVYLHIDQELTWINNADHEVTIVFDMGSPFEKKDPIVVPPFGQQSSGLPTARGRHKYTVIGADGNNDPIVVIEG
jgi:hypothetical protein